MFRIVVRRRLKIYLVTLAAASIATGAGIFINLQIRNTLEQNLLKEYVEQEALIADQVAQNLEANIDGVREKLQLAAAMPDISAAQEGACSAKLAEVFKILGNKVGNLGRVNAKGVFACSLNKALIGTKAELLGDYIPTIFNDPQHKPVLSRAVQPPGADSFIAAVHVPVFTPNGAFDGTVGGAIYFNQLKDKLLKNVTFAQSGFVALYDDNGDILYHPEARFIGQNLADAEPKAFLSAELRQVVLQASQKDGAGSVQYVASNVKKLAAYHSFEVMPGRHWVALVTVPANEAEVALTEVGVDQGFLAFSIVLATAIFAIAAAMLVSRLKALEVDQAKDEFLQLATHQLLTPVAAINWAVEILEDTSLGTLGEAQKKTIKDIKDSNDQQRITVNDLLNVARLESGRLILRPKPSDLRQLLERAVSDVHPLIALRKQTLQVKEGPKLPKVALDPERFRMVLGNLLSNASKYTPDAGALEAGIRTKNRGIEIYVTDSGVGIDKKDLSKLFKKFSRIPNALSEERGGTGLGLYLVKKIVELHGGRIIVTSQSGEGTTFSIFLPGR